MKHFKKSIFFFILLLALSSTLSGNSTDHAELLAQLEEEVSKGNKIALRDVGTLLDKKSTAAEAQRILKKYSLFLSDEFNMDNEFGKKEFLSFYYDKVKQIKFFSPAEVFYVDAFYVEKVEHKIEALPRNLKMQQTVELRKLRNKLNNAIEEKNGLKIKKHLSGVAEMNTPQAKMFLLEILKKKRIQKSRIKNKTDLIVIICEALKDQPTMETLDALLDVTQQGHLPIEHAQPVLAHLTNHRLFEDKSVKKGVKRYRFLIDSLQTMENLRYAGYEKLFDFGKGIFPHPVDYYGRIVGLTNAYPWMKKNALRDLLETEHPRSMLYLVSDFYKNHRAINVNKARKQPVIAPSEYQNLIREYTQLDILVLNGKGNFSDPLGKLSADINSERVAGQNLLLYWMIHYDDFKWNESYEMYINKNEMLAETENLEKLFRRLNSSNNTEALKAYLQLTEGSPAEIVRLSEKYKQLLRSFNKTLPTIRHQYLEQLSVLTEYCRNNDITYLPSAELKNKIDQLRTKMSPKERYHLENKMINRLRLDEVTALEYNACIFENDKEFNFSVGRILDHFYSQHWDKVVSNDAQLRLYLKKTVLFKKIGTIGSCNAYLNKFENLSANGTEEDSHIQLRLKELMEVEPDEDIIYLISELQAKEQPAEESTSSDMDEFLEDPTEFSRNDIRTLPIPNKVITEKIITRLKTEQDKKVISKFVSYLRASPKMELVPMYFQLIDNQFVMRVKYDVETTVADMMVPIIQKVYDTQFLSSEKGKRYDTNKWKNLWETDGKNFKNWHARFFGEKISNLNTEEEIDIKKMNSILSSEYFKEEHLIKCLEALGKIQPVRNVRRLKVKEQLSVRSHLKYFNALVFEIKDLEDIPKLFEVDDAGRMFQYLVERAAKFEDVSELGTFWNGIFRQPWFSTFIGDEKNITEENMQVLENVKVLLENYLEESDFLSEYEEQTTNLNIDQLSLIGKKLEEQLQASIRSMRDETTKALVQHSIVSRVTYKDIGVVVNSIDEFSVSESFKPFLFLQKDFGIPFFDLEDKKARNELIERHAVLSQYDFYKYYLKEHGIDFLNKKGNLDLQKIYDILQYEIVTPFVGGGGSSRDQFTYGVIKLLELQYKTRLGFHEKLNENQTFYAYSSSKRANAWRKFLVEKGYVAVNNDMPPSFNDVVNNR